MRIIDPHIHMLSRTTDDYRLMAEAGVAAVCEPAFWLGTDRQYPESHLDYFNHLATFEPGRAAKRGIRHYAFLGVNPKESENTALAEQVLARIDEYLARPTILGIGEIGLNKNTDNEIRMLRRQLEMAAERRVLCIIHTPHGAAKKRGTELIAGVVKEVDPPRDLCVIDHCTRETLQIARATGCWTGLTVYPGKLSPEEAAVLVRDYGTERMLVNSSADWEDSDPLAVLVAVGAMRELAMPESTIERLVWHNPKEFLGQNPKFTV
jgi:predicted metal-dependent TIM-barrel fold hydrolase